jgi:hypothetical protein
LAETGASTKAADALLAALRRADAKRAENATASAAAASPAAASKATLLLTTDAACTWSLDGKPAGALQPGEPVTVPVTLGEHLITASAGDGTRPWETTVELTQPAQKVISIQLKPKSRLRLPARPK